MTYDDSARKKSDKEFYKHEKTIRKSLGLPNCKIKTDDILDKKYAIDFICGNFLISHKTIRQPYNTFTFRIPEFGDNEYDKLKFVHEKVGYRAKVVVTTINTVFKTLCWAEFGEISKVPISEFHMVGTWRNDNISMQVLDHDVLRRYKGSFATIDLSNSGMPQLI